MFEFKANIVKRRKINKSSLLFGLISAGLLGYLGLTYLDMGLIPIIEKLARQIGFYQYISWIYMGVFALLGFLIIPALQTIMQKKVAVGGIVEFDEEHINISKGKEKYVIPEAKVGKIDFELKALPSGERKNKDQLFGGNFMKIPTKDGTFVCELDINNKIQHEKLIEMIEFLKIEHDVKVKIKNLK